MPLVAPTPRPKYRFDSVHPGEMKTYPVADIPQGMRILRAAYAYGHRNHRRFCGSHQTHDGQLFLVLSRVA